MAGNGDHCGGVKRVLKAVGVAFVLVFSVWFLLLGIANGEFERQMETSASGPGNHKHTMLLGRTRHSVPVKPDPIYVSKRRVPSGPDPIHNRHVGKTRRPPGRV